MNPSHTIANAPPALRKGAYRWPIIIIGLLVAHVLLILWAVSFAVNANFTVVPDYYQRAVAWDQTQAQKRASEKLGWQIVVAADRNVSPLGQRLVSFALTDAQGNPIPGATLAGQYFHHAHGNQVQSFELQPDSQTPGRFAATLPMRDEGLWHFEIVARTADHTWQTQLDQFVSTQGHNTWKP